LTAACKGLLFGTFSAVRAIDIMKKTNILRHTLFTLVFIGAFAIYAAAQDTQMVGGYAPAKLSSKDVKSAASFAVRTHGKKEGHAVTLVKINKAEQQVVSGMNYRLCMTVRHGKHGTPHTVTAVVYQPISKPMQLTSFEEGDCTQ